MLKYMPYCYLIGWSTLNAWYYGSEYGSRSKIANPANLWSTYFTSSVHVSDFRANHGDPDIVEVRKVFECAEDAIAWEYKVLRRLNVRRDKKWINKNDGKAPIGQPWSEGRKRYKSLQTSGKCNPNFGKITSEEIRKKISSSLKGRYVGPNNPMYGKKHSLLSRQKMSTNRVKLIGPLNPKFGNRWSVDQRLVLSKQRNPKVFAFIHSEHGIVRSSVYEMPLKFPTLKKSGVRALTQGKLLQYKNWSLLLE